MSDTDPTPPPTQNSPGRVEDSASPDSTANTALPAGVPAPVPARVGRYEIRQVLGSGAFGRVYRAFDPDLHREVAIKLPNPQAMTPELHERFLREARAAATIHHPNVCPIYDVGTDAAGPSIVMHFIAGGTLDGLLKHRNRPFSGPHAAVIVRKITLGVAAAHAKGVLHRDLKPANVLWDDVNREVLVTDFGLARIGNAAQISRTGEILGTPLT